MKGKITIDSERCKGCGYCIEACPLKLIVMTRHFNNAGYFTADIDHHEKCTGCAVCANMCPEVAIMVYRNGAAVLSKKG